MNGYHLLIIKNCGPEKNERIISQVYGVGVAIEIFGTVNFFNKNPTDE